MEESSIFPYFLTKDRFRQMEILRRGPSSVIAAMGVMSFPRPPGTSPGGSPIAIDGSPSATGAIHGPHRCPGDVRNRVYISHFSKMGK